MKRSLATYSSKVAHKRYLKVVSFVCVYVLPFKLYTFMNSITVHMTSFYLLEEKDNEVTIKKR